MTFYQIVFLFFAYSFLGWVGEVLFTAVVHRKYQDRGVLSGPLCLLYGVGGLVITFALGDIREGWFFLLVFSAVYATVIEWIGGHILEYTTHTRWWDYSAMPFNLDGYVCLGASLTWGALGVVVLKWGNPLLLALYSLVPHGIWVVVLLAALVYALQLYADFSGGIDISRGVAQMFGITMGENFRRPYFSRTLTEYWHRWHISLGDWLRNYLFYPLSISKAFLNWGRHARQHLGSHIGKVLPTAVASLITFLIIGLWHGASWKYVAFGFWNGMVILVSTLLQPVSDKVVAALHIERKSAWYQVFSMLRTFVVVLIGYYFDIADGFRAAMGMMLKSVTDLHLSQLRPSAVLEALPLTMYDWAVLAFGTLVIFTASVIQERSQRTIREILDEKCLALRWAVLLAGIFAVVLMGVYGPGVQASEFVYMQF